MNDQTETESFLGRLYTLASFGDDQCVTDLIFRIDKLLVNGEFRLCDMILDRLDVGRLSTSAMRSFLCITDAAKDELPSRRGLYSRIGMAMLAIVGEDKTKRLIGEFE